MLAAEHTERMARVSERAARAEARAAADSQVKVRISILQEQLQGLTAEVRNHKQKEEVAKRAAAEANEAARHVIPHLKFLRDPALRSMIGPLTPCDVPRTVWQAHTVASRTNVELVRANAEVASLKQRLGEVPRREDALKRQLAARTEQLEAVWRAPQLPATSLGGAEGVGNLRVGDDPFGNGSDGVIPVERETAVSEAVTDAVRAERERWAAVLTAIDKVHTARQSDERIRIHHRAQFSQVQEALRDTEHTRDAALSKASSLSQALADAQGRLARQNEGADAAARAASLTVSRPPEPSACADVRRSCNLSPTSASTTAVERRASTTAVERWAVEKRLQRKLDGLRTKLNGKSRELCIAEGALVKAKVCHKHHTVEHTTGPSIHETAAAIVSGVSPCRRPSKPRRSAKRRCARA